jgi:hypothetical protein
MHREGMKTRSLDLRERIVAAKRRRNRFTGRFFTMGASAF